MNPQQCLETLRTIFKDCGFANFCGMQIDETECGRALLHMDMDSDKGNMAGYLHGGAMEALIDNADGAVCLTIGAHVVTLHSDVSYIKGVPLKTMPRIFAEARIMKATHHMIFVDVVVRSGKEELLARGNMVMFRNGTDTRIPEKW